jgi:hypothetical protein
VALPWKRNLRPENNRNSVERRMSKQNEKLERNIHLRKNIKLYSMTGKKRVLLKRCPKKK